MLSKQSSRVFVLSCVLAACAASSVSQAVPPPLDVELIASGLTRPVFVCSPPGDCDRLFFIEKRGVIRILNLKTLVINGTPFLDIDALVTGGTTNESEQGLLGMCFHPDYANNGVFYVDYTSVAGSGDTRIESYVVSGDPDIADSTSAQLVLTYDQPFSNHNGGWIGFGPDGYMWIPSGDGGSACDPGQRAQDITDQLLGKVLRIDVDGADNIPRNADDDTVVDVNRNYSIPADNPYVGIAGDDEIWAFGLRNPWRPSFDRGTGDFYIADVGQNNREEVNYQPAGTGAGLNYGWDCEEGFLCANASSQCVGTPNACVCGQAGLTDPILDYTHGGGRCSISGGYVYRGCKIPALQGTYFYGDYCSAQIFTVPAGGGVVTEVTADLDPPGAAAITDIVSFGEDDAGEMYIVDQGPASAGAIWRIIGSPALSRADIDGDADKDLTDADLLVEALLSKGPIDDCVRRRADVNADCVLDGLDIQPWIDAP